jgi:hypothetical protein
MFATFDTAAFAKIICKKKTTSVFQAELGADVALSMRALPGVPDLGGKYIMTPQNEEFTLLSGSDPNQLYLTHVIRGTDEPFINFATLFIDESNFFLENSDSVTKEFLFCTSSHIPSHDRPQLREPRCRLV